VAFAVNHKHFSTPGTEMALSRL